MSRRSQVLPSLRVLERGTLADLLTRDRRLWRTRIRERTRVNISDQAYGAARNALASRLKGLRETHHRIMGQHWKAGRLSAFWQAYRQGVHAMCMVAGLHLASRRRAGKGGAR
ncbi:hypothetical protein K7W42_22180 [Deinococcus sp. HMF7604]|uniref:hypothetical protein n=1 Tax=Deinococcus betulae TaxID=2873312 RepID=UPI001CCAF5AA|nr:hypothetical protein [Deinococcus betulae]MBZ9753544.1 hypothetical protein [Deinococcus betulae]